MTFRSGVTVAVTLTTTLRCSTGTFWVFGNQAECSSQRNINSVHLNIPTAHQYLRRVENKSPVTFWRWCHVQGDFDRIHLQQGRFILGFAYVCSVCSRIHYSYHLCWRQCSTRADLRSGWCCDIQEVALCPCVSLGSYQDNRKICRNSTVLNKKLLRSN
jgi:hypothetical protein